MRTAEKALALAWELSLLGYLAAVLWNPALLEAWGAAKVVGIAAWALIVVLWAAVKTSLFLTDAREKGRSWALGRVRRYASPLAVVSFVACLITPAAGMRWALVALFILFLALSITCSAAGEGEAPAAEPASRDPRPEGPE